MIREVYIDEQQIDIENDNAAGYIFTSPIFRDITKILSNRTTTYKVPKTQRNLTIFGLSNNPDVYSIFPYREHTFEEIRDGLTFIKGICTLLKSGEEDLELSVVWGNTINLLKLKDLKLRDLSSSEYLTWSNDTPFLPDSSTAQKGFIKIDFGHGLSDIQYIHPSVTYDYILKLIEADTGVQFIYDVEKFGDVFTKRWVPLIEKNANQITWGDKYFVRTNIIGYNSTGIYSFSYFTFTGISGNLDLVGSGVLPPANYIKGKADSIVTIQSSTFLKVPNTLVDPASYQLRVIVTDMLTIYADQYFPITMNDDGDYVCTMALDFSFDLTEDKNIYIGAQYRKSTSYVKLDGTEILVTSIGHDIYVRYDEVKFGDKFPIVPNLPDLTVVDFLKNIMWQYGLFVFYKADINNSAIQFVSVSDIYDGKYKAYDWTNLIADRKNMPMTYVYSDYSQKNIIKYKKDDSVKTKADGYFIIDNQTIPKEKELFELYFAPSDNITDSNANTYAYIPIYDASGNYKSVSYRVLKQKIYNDESTGIAYVAALFDKDMYFMGDNGLIKKYYDTYQFIINQPAVLECYVYLKGLDLYTYNELVPIFIDGTYYMMQEITVNTDGLAKCKLIRMPYYR